MGERRIARREAFHAYFAQAAEIAFAMCDLEMIGAPAAQAYPPTGLLVGLRESSDRDRGLGIVVSVHPGSGKLICFTSIDPVAVALLRWGSIKLDKAFSKSPAAA